MVFETLCYNMNPDFSDLSTSVIITLGLCFISNELFSTPVIFSLSLEHISMWVQRAACDARFMFNPFIDQSALSKVICLSDAKQLSLITSNMCPSHTFADVHKFVRGEDGGRGEGVHPPRTSLISHKFFNLDRQ